MWIWNVLQRARGGARHGARAGTAGGAPRRTARSIAFAALAALSASLTACQGLDPLEGAATADPSVTTAARPDEHEALGRCDWDQWGGNAGHTGAACKEVDHFDRISAHLTFDPFVDQELADTEARIDFANLAAHFQTPLLVDDNVYMEFKAGTYTSCDPTPAGALCRQTAWNTQVWTERAFHWSHGRLVADWTFASDWKPEPFDLAQFEPVFHAIVVGPFVYVPGASGSLHKLDRRTGHRLATIRLPGVGSDPNTFVAGGIASDAHGNLYYNALALAAVDPVHADPRGSWLVKVHPDNTVTMVAFSTIAVGAPAATDACLGEFLLRSQFPAPPSPDAVPPSAPCGAQRPPLNVTPAVGEDGTVVTVSTAHRNPRYTFVVAVHADLTPKWATSLRGLLHDGCGVGVPSDAPPDTTDFAVKFLHCRVGARVGVDPRTNEAPAGQAPDQSTSSPVILPDGGVLYGTSSFYNRQRGHLFKLDAHGAPAATYDFGWDVTPAVYRHDGTYSILIKDNVYPFGSPGRFLLSQLDPQLRVEWSYQATNTDSCHRDPDGHVVCVNTGEHPTGFEWCVNAPAVDSHGNLYANSEDGWVYKIGQGGHLLDRTFLLQPLAAAYTPISIDRDGRLFSLNGGDMFVIGGPGHDDDDDHGHHYVR
jgi:hypothetical protein